MFLDEVVSFITLHVVTIVTFFLSFITIAHMLLSRKKPPYMIAWLVSIIFLPYIGILLYVIFNARKIPKNVLKKKRINLKEVGEGEGGCENESEIEKLLKQLSIASASSNNHFYLCKDSKDAYENIIKLLKEAKESIYITTYIFGNDEITKTILDILIQKVKEGVRVKLLIDSFGSFLLELFPYSLKRFKNAGGEYRFFMSVLKHPFKNRFNCRNHRKMIIIDLEVVVSGGINISNDYLSSNPNSTSWLDIAFIIKGDAAFYYGEIFWYDWQSQSEKQEDITIKSKDYNYHQSRVQVVPSGPDVSADALYESILYALFLAKKRVWIVTPYFVPDGALMDALIIAKHRGLDIKIVLPKKSDQFLADISRSGFLRDLQKEKIDILLYKPKMLHAKAMIIDENLALVGSSNFDARSFFYNFEIMSFLYTKKDILSVSEWIENIFDECEVGLKAASKVRIMFENFFKMLSPAL